MINALIKTYTRMVGVNSLVLFRAIKTYYVSSMFRVNVLIEYFRHAGKYRKKIRNKLLSKYGVEIGENSTIGQDLTIEHYNGIVIGDKVIIGNRCTLYQQVTIGQNHGKYPVIGNDVTVYPGAKLFGGINIGNNVTIGANSVVNSDIPDDAIVAGVPARIVRMKGEKHELN